MYLAIHLVLWTKVLLFYQLYGQGILLRLLDPQYTLAPLLSPYVFTSNLLIFDWLFHQAIHVSIAVVIFLFARRFSPSLVKLVPIILIADVLHNVGYWFTNAFATFDLLAFDFIDDFIFMLLFYYLCKFFFKQQISSKYVEKAKRIQREAPIKVGTVKQLRKRYE